MDCVISTHGHHQNLHTDHIDNQVMLLVLLCQILSRYAEAPLE
jgi:hypothetical protein